MAAEMKDELHRQGEGWVWVQSGRNHRAEQAPGWAEPQLGLVQWLIWPVGGWRQHLPRQGTKEEQAGPKGGNSVWG